MQRKKSSSGKLRFGPSEEPHEPSTQLRLPRVLSAPIMLARPAPIGGLRPRATSISLPAPALPSRRSGTLLAEPAPFAAPRRTEKVGLPAGEQLLRKLGRTRLALGELQLPSRLPVRALPVRPNIPHISVPVQSPVGKRTRADRGSPPTEDDEPPAVAPAVASSRNGSANSSGSEPLRIFATSAAARRPPRKKLPRAVPTTADDWALSPLGPSAKNEPPPPVSLEWVADGSFHSQPFSPPVVPISARLASGGNNGASSAHWPKPEGLSAPPSSAVASGSVEPDRAAGKGPPPPITLRYDSTLQCYFDPSSGKYYEMR
ncbi:hypothetical protein T492DRAFT_891919 [Pavlovales sp. CCMP2436]|nr:hypothetical protein T492DRAFT_891919 [Pavlovales sp. CCMP2436]